MVTCGLIRIPASSASALDTLTEVLFHCSIAAQVLCMHGCAEVSAAVEAEYVAAVQPHAYGTFNHHAPGAYMYELAKRAKASSGGGARQRQKKLMRELRGMQSLSLIHISEPTRPY